MSNKRTISLNTYSQESVNHTSPFSILPLNTTPPEITLQPLTSLTQQTWASNIELNPNNSRSQRITPSSDIVTALQGTEITFELFAGNYATQANGNTPSSLQYRWRLNGSLIGSLNTLNNNLGTNKVLIMSESCTPLLSGEYVCEVINQYGSTETEPFTLNIVDPFDHPKLYKNLITNGSGEGGLDGWQADSDIKVTPFQRELERSLNFSSFRLSGMIINDSGSNTTTQIRPEFRFSNTSHAGMFNESYRKRVARDTTFTDIDRKSSADGILDYQDQYYSQGQIPQIIPNEDYNTPNDVAGFFPGIAWLDAYNKNTNENIISLQSELTDTTPTYFTRDKIKFKNAGGKAQTSLSQTIDLSDIADMIDGNAYGITHATSQFFAYVGAGITNYKIRLSTPDGIAEFPYYIGTSEEYAEMFASNFRDGQDGAFTIKDTFYDVDQQKRFTYSEMKNLTRGLNLTEDEKSQTNFRTGVIDILNSLHLRRDYYENSENINDILIEAANNLPDDGWDWWRSIKINFNNLQTLLVSSSNITPNENINRLQGYLGITGILSANVDGYTDQYTEFTYTPTTSDLNTFYKGKRPIFGSAKDFTYDSDELKRLVTRNLYNFLKDTISEIETNILPNVDKTLAFIARQSSKISWILGVERIARYAAGEARKRKINEYSDIEIIPVLDDQTKIQINYLDGEGNIIKTDTINGPDEQTVWAIKEKVYFPLTLYPLFEFVKPSGSNAITVFNQKYTDTLTINPFFNLLNVGDGYGGAIDQIRDVNAKFLMNKYDFKTYGGAYPPNNRNTNPRGDSYSQNSYKAVYDFGAAAMFGVELTAAIPKRTRSVQITVLFDHKSTIIDDNSPQTKGWTSSEIYSDEYGQSTGYSNRLVEYGNPRCGITSMKYLVAANNFEKSPKYPSYYLPPASATVLGLQKEKYLNPSAFNSADAPEFSYNLIFPTELPEL